MKYSIIYADPPWSYEDKLSMGKRGSYYKYETLSIEDIKGLPIQNIAADDCVLFLWATWPLIQEGIDVVNAWGFKYKTGGFVWMKTTKTTPRRVVRGMGRYTRGNTEFVLIGRKGKMLDRHNKGVPQVIIAPRGVKNSEKPREVVDRINNLYGPDLPKIELFARIRRTGSNWNATGLEYDGKYIQDFLKEESCDKYVDLAPIGMRLD